MIVVASTVIIAVSYVICVDVNDDVDDYSDGWEVWGMKSGEKSYGGVHMQRLDAIHKQFITFHRRSLKAVMMMMMMI